MRKQRSKHNFQSYAVGESCRVILGAEQESEYNSLRAAMSQFNRRTGWLLRATRSKFMDGKPRTVTITRHEIDAEEIAIRKLRATRAKNRRLKKERPAKKIQAGITTTFAQRMMEKHGIKI